MNLKRVFLLCSFTTYVGIVPFIYSAQANNQSGTSLSATQDEKHIREPIIKLYDALNKIQQPQSGTFAQRTNILLPALKEAYDFPTILSNTVGYRYSSFSDNEKQELMNAFQNFTVARYLSSFAPNGGAKFQIMPTVRPAPFGKDQIVSTKIGAANDFSSAVEINYLVRNTPQGWKIVDVLLEGHISQVAVQHGDFASTLAKGGNQELINMLKKKIQSFSSGQ